MKKDLFYSTIRLSVNKLLSVLGDFQKISKIYQSPFSIQYHLLSNKWPHVVRLKMNGKVLTIHSSAELFFIPAGLVGFSYDEKRDVLALQNGVQLKSGVTNGDIIGVFVEENYNFLNVKNEMVIDVGANIADSAIWFAMKGARNVVAFEPYPLLFKIAKENVSLNTLEDKISIVNAGISGKSGTIMVDDAEGSLDAPLVERETGHAIPLLTLEDIISEFSIDDALLKMDCEGCEYDTILNTESQLLRKFKRIQVEYHYGPNQIVQKLRLAGFRVEFSRAKYFHNSRLENPHLHWGYIYAERESD